MAYYDNECVTYKLDKNGSGWYLKKPQKTKSKDKSANFLILLKRIPKDIAYNDKYITIITKF
jgi:hypothetical protein